MIGARTLRIGTRSSRLARWQTARIAELLRRRTGTACEIVPVVTEGDRVTDRPLPEIGGKGLFTQALDAALRAGEVDLAVHSLKDLPVEDGVGIAVAAVCERADARDVLIAPAGRTLARLPAEAKVGTSSTRRIAQLRAARPDLVLLPLRGNVDTRVRKVRDGEYAAIVIAAAGVERLELVAAIAEYLPVRVMLPAPGQGALAVTCRADDHATRDVVATLDDPAARAETAAERAFLAALGGGCAAPIAALGRLLTGGRPSLRLTGLVAAPDGTRVVRVSGYGDPAEPAALARRVAATAAARGARELLT